MVKSHVRAERRVRPAGGMMPPADALVEVTIMRPITSRFTALLSLSFIALAAVPCAAQQAYPDRAPSSAAVSSIAPMAGVYRLQLTAKDGASLQVRLVVERLGEGLSGTLVSEDNGVAHVDLKFVGDELRATATTSLGEGVLVLRESAAGMTGTFTVGKRVWMVSGERSV